MWPRKKDKPEYIKWEYTHTANHARSAGAMDAAGIKKILCRFVRPHGLATPPSLAMVAQSPLMEFVSLIPILVA